MITSGGDIHYDAASGQGTVGGWLIHPATQQRFGFSNCHVIAALGQAPVGALLYQQGRPVGSVHSHIVLEQAYYNSADLALFKVDAAAALRWAHAPPTGNTEPRVNMRVYKHGASSGITHGVVTATHRKRRMWLNGTPFWFNDVVSIQGLNGPFSEVGDSGALVMTMQDQAVAVLFGKEPDGSHAYAFPIAAAAPLFAGLHYAG